MRNLTHCSIGKMQRRWLNNYNQRIRNEVGPELKKYLRMKGYEWMMKKTRSIPERGDVDLKYFIGHSSSNSFKYSHILIWIAIFFQIWTGKSIINDLINT